MNLLKKTRLSNLNIVLQISATKPIVFYLAGYVFSTFSRILRFTKNNNQNSPEILQEYLTILAADKLGAEK